MKRILFVLMISLILILSGCSKSYDKASLFEAIKIEETSTKVKGSKYKNLSIDESYKNSILKFSFFTASKLLEEENVMYSPISLYFALSELAELTSGSTRQELLDALYVSDINVLRNGYENLYKKINYINDDSTLNIASSIWLNNSFKYKDEPLKVLANKYYSSSFGVNFNDSNTKKMIEDWVSDHTGGKLGNGDFKDLDPSTVFVLLNAIYFYDEWESKFDKDLNVQDIFFNVGKVTYMRNKLDSHYTKTNEYEAGELEFKNGMRIRFILPNESLSINDFIKDEDKLKHVLGNRYINTYKVNYKIPKFNYKSSLNLIEFAKTLGINEVFSNADFTSLTDEDLFVSKMFQKTFIEIDENGGRAAAYTGIEAPKSSAPVDEIHFTLNRPFLYSIYSGEYPIFIGVVKDPNNHGTFNYS